MLLRSGIYVKVSEQHTFHNLTMKDGRSIHSPVSMLSLTMQVPLMSTASQGMMVPLVGMTRTSPGTRSVDRASSISVKSWVGMGVRLELKHSLISWVTFCWESRTTVQNTESSNLQRCLQYHGPHRKAEFTQNVWRTVIGPADRNSYNAVRGHHVVQHNVLLKLKRCIFQILSHLSQTFWDSALPMA